MVICGFGLLLLICLLICLLIAVGQALNQGNSTLPPTTEAVCICVDGNHPADCPVCFPQEE